MMQSTNPTDMSSGVKRPGMVSLVGAGPGDPGLLTLKAKACLERADMVIYDALANEELLIYLKPQAKRIYVGKKAGQHTMAQEEINRLLVDSARQYAHVVRLKGGDPFVFGRGGEEALELARHNIPFEIVPGVTAGVAAPAYAGIPVTQRELATSVAFVTGHESPTKAAASATVDWAQLAKSCDTLVIYMGVKNLAHITRTLLESGMSGEMPAAVIEQGTYAGQRTVSATIERIAQQAEEAHIAPPAIIVIGKVAALRPQLSWFERRPLFGKTALITRNIDAEQALASQLADQGASLLYFPTIEIAPITPNTALDEAFKTLQNYDWLLFTSRNSVRIFFEQLLQRGQDARALHRLKIAAIGRPTHERLRDYGLTADLIPSVFTSEQLVDEMIAQIPLDGMRVLFPGSTLSNPTIAERLSEAGASVDVVPLYATTLPNVAPERISELKQRIKERRIDWITFTSSSTVEHFMRLVGVDEIAGLRNFFSIASIGPMTSKTLERYGFTPDVSAAEHTFRGLVQAIVQATESPL